MTEYQEEAYVEILEIVLRDHIRNSLPDKENCQGVQIDMNNILKEGMEKGENLISKLLKEEETLTTSL